MKKTLIAATSAVALIVGGISPAWAFLDSQTSGAVAAQTLVQVKADAGNVNTMNALLQAQGNVLNNNFGNGTFQNQAFNSNNINTGANSALQSGTTSAISVNVNDNF